MMENKLDHASHIFTSDKVVPATLAYFINSCNNMQFSSPVIWAHLITPLNKGRVPLSHRLPQQAGA